MGHAISSADLDSDHNLRNETLSKILENPTVTPATEGSEPAKDSNTKKADAKSKTQGPEAKPSSTATPATEGSA